MGYGESHRNSFELVESTVLRSQPELEDMPVPSENLREVAIESPSAHKKTRCGVQHAPLACLVVEPNNKSLGAVLHKPGGLAPGDGGSYL